MKCNRLFLGLALLCLIAPSAEATRNPTPPPSGIVVHLFGPDSVMPNITPILPGATAKPAVVPSPQAASSSEPTMGAVLHQMFVVGDPDDPSLPSLGRAADRHP